MPEIGMTCEDTTKNRISRKGCDPDVRPSPSNPVEAVPMDVLEASPERVKAGEHGSEGTFPPPGATDSDKVNEGTIVTHSS